MTQRDQSSIAAALEREDGDWQLTLDGGAVKHPPPRPRVRCRDCDKIITLTVHGEFHQHSNGYGEPCPSSGRR